MPENTQRPHSDEHTETHDVWWQGYFQGLKETSETWVAVIEEAIDRQAGVGCTSVLEDVVDQANRELGFRGQSGIAKPR